MAITAPKGIVRLNADGTVNASGWLTNNWVLKAVWGAVIPATPAADPANPWDSGVSNPVQGSFTFNQQSQTFEWQVPNISGARGNCQEDSFYVWYAFDTDACFDRDKSSFIGDSTGSGCGSGGSGGGGAFPMNALLTGMAPRYYRVIPEAAPDAGMNPMRDRGREFSQNEIILEYDEAESNLSLMSWRSNEPLAAWSLRVTPGETVLSRDPVGQAHPMAGPRDAWACRSFSFMKPNRLAAQAAGRCCGTNELAAVRVEPLA